MFHDGMYRALFGLARSAFCACGSKLRDNNSTNEDDWNSIGKMDNNKDNPAVERN